MNVHLYVHLSDAKGRRAEFELYPVKLSSVTDLLRTWQRMGWIHVHLDMALDLMSEPKVENSCSQI